MTHHTIHNSDEDLNRMVVKGTGSRVVLELCWHAWTDLGLNKGRGGKFLHFSFTFPSNKKIIFYISCFNAKPHYTWFCSRPVLGQTYIASYFAPFGLRNLQILRQHIRSLTNPTLPGMSTTVAARHAYLIIGKHTWCIQNQSEKCE